MKEKYNALLGVSGIIFAFSFIFIAIILSPWFRWENSALSDLGHSVRSEVAPIFNLGLLTSGFLIIYYSVTSFKNHAKYTSYLLILTGLSLQLVGAFDEVYKTVHLFLIANNIEVREKILLCACGDGSLLLDHVLWCFRPTI